MSLHTVQRLRGEGREEEGPYTRWETLSRDFWGQVTIPT